MNDTSTPAGPDATSQRGNAAAWIGWHLLSVLAIMVLATELGLGASLWELPANSRNFVAGLALTHLLGALALWWQAVPDARRYLGRTMVTFAIAYGGFAFALLMVDGFYSRRILLAAGFLSLFAAAIPGVFSRALSRMLLPGLALGVALLVGVSFALKRLSAGTEGSIARFSTVPSIFHPVHMSVTERLLPAGESGGAVQALSSGFLLAAGDGTLRFLKDVTTSAPLTVTTLPYRVPLNRDAFVAAAPDDAQTDVFRLGDLLVHDTGTRLTLVASHHFWNSDAECFVLRVSTTEAEREPFLDGTAAVEWRTVFDTEPCLPLRTGPRAPHVLAGPFSGNILGGRLAALDHRTVLLTVGDHGFDGWNSEDILSQDPEAHYGKVVSIDLVTGESEIYSMGHRNPQGLLVTGDGQIWATEHGPDGGDELNLIERGRNYGWPFETYGVQYGLPTWPLSTRQGWHEEYTQPRHAWIPSVGVSNLIAVEHDLFPVWQGDLLVAALASRSLYRLRYREGRILFSERIFVRARVRDLAEAPDGRIVLLLDGGAVAVLEPAAAAGPSDGQRDGTLLFASCQGCHRIGDGLAHGIGPDLRGVFDRDIASAPGYSYSAALRSLSGRWTEERLNRFLADPRGYAPGTTMESQGIADATDRLLLITYLRTNR
jgi:aldose sugar dehydrogenase